MDCQPVLPASPARNAVATGQVALDDLDPHLRGRSGDELLHLLQRTCPSHEELVVCHGDPTVENVVFDDTGTLTGLIDLDRLGTADGYRDLAITKGSLTGRWGKGFADRLLRRYGIEHVDDSRITFYQLLDEFF